MTVDKLYENLAALMDAIRKARPAAAKGIYIRRVTITSTMGPGIRVDPNLALALEVKSKSIKRFVDGQLAKPLTIHKLVFYSIMNKFI